MSRTSEAFFWPPAPPFSYLQAGTSSQVLLGAAHLPGRAPPQTIGSALTPLSLGSALVFTTTSAPSSRPAVVQSVPGLLLPLVGLGSLISQEDFPRAVCDSAATGQHSGALTDWSHPASASGPIVWQERRDIVIDEGPMMPEPAPQTSNPQLPSYQINLQTFSTTQFEGPPFVQTRPMFTAIEETGCELEERLALAKRPKQLDFSEVAYLQIASKLPKDRVVVLTCKSSTPSASKRSQSSTPRSRDTQNHDLYRSITIWKCPGSLSATPPTY